MTFDTLASHTLLLYYIVSMMRKSALCVLLPTPQGYGTNFYGPEEYYEGEWYAGRRSGWGRMYYADGSVYEGEWYDDKRNGKGLLKLGEGAAN